MSFIKCDKSIFKVVVKIAWFTLNYLQKYFLAQNNFFFILWNYMTNWCLKILKEVFLDCLFLGIGFMNQKQKHKGESASWRRKRDEPRFWVLSDIHVKWMSSAPSPHLLPFLCPAHSQQDKECSPKELF